MLNRGEEVLFSFQLVTDNRLVLEADDRHDVRLRIDNDYWINVEMQS